MPVTDVRKDAEALTMTITSHFDAAPEQVWTVWSDPRRLERWWGPPTYPATVVDHDLAPGGRVSYYMTSPEGEKYHGYWNVTTVEAPRSLEFVDGFADDTGAPNPDMPQSQTAVSIAADGDRTVMTITTTFSSTEAMEQLLAMGMEDGITLAINKIDPILA